MAVDFDTSEFASDLRLISTNHPFEAIIRLAILISVVALIRLPHLYSCFKSFIYTNPGGATTVTSAMYSSLLPYTPFPSVFPHPDMPSTTTPNNSSSRFLWRPFCVLLRQQASSQYPASQLSPGTSPSYTLHTSFDVSFNSAFPCSPCFVITSFTARSSFSESNLR